ncbi:MAG: hypothetical protein JNM18_15600 [Planctomycetaceae bacterium]|nr:hypothetical protein [Planctomycetaceae bacterium]
MKSFLKHAMIASMVAFLSVAQGEARGDRKEFDRVLEDTRSRLLKEGHESEDINQDMQMIGKLYERLVIAHDGNETEIPAIASATWRFLRAKKYAGSTKLADTAKAFCESDFGQTKNNAFLMAASYMGKLTVESNPPEGRINVSGNDWEEITTATRFVVEGEHPVTVKKDKLIGQAKVVVRKRASTKIVVELR